MFSSEELLYWLQRAKGPDGAFCESPELAVLRRYAAACRLDCALLQPALCPDGSPNPKAEDAFLLELEHAVEQALIQVWADENKSAAAARADWLFASLFLESPQLAGQEAGAAQPPIAIAVQWANLALWSAAPAAAATGPLPWLADYRLWFAPRWARRLDADPVLLRWLHKIVVRALVAAWHDVQANADAQARLVETLDRLPEPLGTAVRQDDDLIRTTGLGGYDVGGRRFDLQELGRALRRAVNGEAAVVLSLDGRLTYQAFAAAGDDGGTVVLLRHADSGEEHRFIGPEVELFVEGDDAWRTLLQRRRRWFDCSRVEHAALIDALIHVEDLDERRERVRGWVRTNLPMHYDRVRDALKDQRWQTAGDLLPQDAGALFRHLRLSESDDSPFPAALTCAAVQLMQDEGLLTAVERMRGLPVPLPEPLVVACRLLPEGERQKLYDQLAQGHPSPLARAHLVALVGQCEGRDSAAFAASMAQLANDDAAMQTALFLQLVRWLDDAVASHFASEQWPDWLYLELAWFHADRLWSLWLDAGLSLEQLQARSDRAGLSSDGISKMRDAQSLSTAMLHGRDGCRLPVSACLCSPMPSETKLPRSSGSIGCRTGSGASSGVISAGARMCSVLS